jgi:hypothetical protein
MNRHPLNTLEPRDKKPPNARAIDAWILQAEKKVGIGAGRLGWMVASNVVIAALQRVLYDDNEPRFLLKGGTYLEFRLGLAARATKDVDTLFRGTFDQFIEVMDDALAKPFDGIEFARTEPKAIEVSTRIQKPRRFDIKLKLQGRTWRNISVEVSADEGALGKRVERFETPSLAYFGLVTPPTTAGIAVDYQVAQKLHACTDPHSLERPNDRVRDVVDLLLLQRAFYENELAPESLVQACTDLFSARANEAMKAQSSFVRQWPPIMIAYRHWGKDYKKYADAVGQAGSLDEAVAELNRWVSVIDKHRDEPGPEMSEHI